MTSRERLNAVLSRKIPDHVPCSPDTSNMIPARLTKKPFWDFYLYQDPPIWKAYIDCVKYFGFDSLMDGYVSIGFDGLVLGENPYDGAAIVFQNNERIVTQEYRTANGKRFWANGVTVYFRDNPPSHGVKPEQIGLPATPSDFKEIEGVREWPKSGELLSYVKKEMGGHGLVGVSCGTSSLISTEQDIYDFADNPGAFYKRRDELMSFCEKKFKRLMALPDRPDFICTGASGTLVYQSVDTFRELGLPIVKLVTRFCKEAGIPSHVHSCGPETALVKICAEETDLTVIDPLEIPPMGDCNLKELKRLYGGRLVLKGNLHTTEIMLNGTPQDVADAAKRAIDDAAYGGGFILSTGDQCGRDTPDANIFAMIETAKTYGKY